MLTQFVRNPELPVMHPDCRFVIVVPVYHEQWQRLIRQLNSLQQQEGINPAEFEVIYVVNNGPDCPARVRNHNQRSIHTLRVARAMGMSNIHVIDAASKGREIPGCNVGKARHLGLEEACRRFEGIGQDGWIINTDADCHFDDPDYFNKLKALIKQHPDAVAFNGGLEYEFSPDPSDRLPDLFRRMYRMRLIIGWHRLSEAIDSGNQQQGYRDHFKMSGAHMIASVSSIRAISGMPQIAAGEDHAFYDRLRTLAKAQEQELPNIRHLLTVVTAARLSERTPESITDKVRGINLDQTLMGRDLLALLQGSEAGNNLVEVTYKAYRTVLNTLAGLPGGNEMKQELDLVFGRLDRHMLRLESQTAKASEKAASPATEP